MSESRLTKEQEKQLADLKKEYGTVYIIVGVDEDDNSLVSFLKKPSYETKKNLTMMLMRDKSKITEVGEALLVECYIGGVDLFENEDTRFEAALAAVEAIQVKTSFELLKKN